MKETPVIPEELYREFFATAPIGFGVSDEHGRLIDFNQAMLDYSGWTREEIEKMGGVVDLYYDGPADRDRCLAIVREKGHLDRAEVRFKKKDGTWFWSALSLRPLLIGGKRYMLAISEDISQRKRAEAEREQRVKELEQITRMMVDRENKMIELKDRIRRFETRNDAP